MIKTNISCNGCLALFLGAIAIILLFKFWFIILILFVLFPFLYKKLLIEQGWLEKIQTYIASMKEYKSKPGKTYKHCSFCNKKSDRHATKCSFCGKAFE